MYTVQEFRQHMRKAFNDADGGHEVVISRYGQNYQLISLVEGPLKGHMGESTPTDVVPKTSEKATWPLNKAPDAPKVPKVIKTKEDAQKVIKAIESNPITYTKAIPTA